MDQATDSFSNSDSDCDLAFAAPDLTGVDFSDSAASLGDDDLTALRYENLFLNGTGLTSENETEATGCARKVNEIFRIVKQLEGGQYLEVLRGDTCNWLLAPLKERPECEDIRSRIRTNLSTVTTARKCVEAELFAIAALSLFMQLNYTGPMVEDVSILEAINPHSHVEICFKKENELETKTDRSTYDNSVLAELTVDGLWPCQVAKLPYLLLIARCVLATLSNPQRQHWSHNMKNIDKMPKEFCEAVSHLSSSSIWSARAAVAHERLFLSAEPTVTLWTELEETFQDCIRAVENCSRRLRATIRLEYGLACHHFQHGKMGKKQFEKARQISSLSVEVTGAMGKRTKFQTKATAQMVVRAVSAPSNQDEASSKTKGTGYSSEGIKSQMVEHTDESILLDRVKFDNDPDNNIDELRVLDQAIILALCLDVKNTNPSDGLTAEEMSAYLARVLCHHDDWTLYSTALLERAWLEFEGNHSKERALLQLQALADQHTTRLTITQSTRKSVDESSPVQDRLRNVHSIVYPPRWHMLRDVAERYAELGILTSAAEIFAEIEHWDEVVDCYRRAGKEKLAEEVVRNRLAIAETPRMFAALGDITNEIGYYDKAIDISNGRFCQAHVSRAEHLFIRGRLEEALVSFRDALALRPLITTAWFRVGTICMRLGDWKYALTAFSEVVQQHPEESEAWANVAAVHQHEQRPAEAYPALVESLKNNRKNWRVWENKLYVCLDLKKYDEAIQACNMLIDLKQSLASQDIPDPEEKCVKARRSLPRVHNLLERIRASRNDSWIFEIMAYFHAEVGEDSHVFENLMKEYRSLTSVRAWEKDDDQVRKVTEVASQIVHYQRKSKEDLLKSKFLLSGVVKRIEKAASDTGATNSKYVKAIHVLLREILTELDNTE
ncbi:unnamed protein product [Cylindrotheca closterium]|uniref:Tetratricopeptide repeat protein 27 n=1 Tax=Cylindrotheca closterium TaxID=2856 RepID=A0AAD2G7D5_9STRA|nr:unnamed protein product [Cylindrotheca closterium]